MALQSRCPSSLTKASAASPSTADVSTAKGTKKWLDVRTVPALAPLLVLPQLKLVSQQWGGVRVHMCLGIWCPR